MTAQAKPTTKCPTRHRSALIAFMKEFGGCQVRDVTLCRTNGIASRFGDRDKLFPQLRTKKNDHLAMVFDELGNAFVLTSAGVRKQLLKGEF